MSPQNVIKRSERPLTSEFFSRDTLLVARELLGCELVRYFPESGETIRLKIVETEAYTQDDPACHAYGRTIGRAEILYKSPSTAYVYLIYGMYNCLNVVTEPEGKAGAVLFRAMEPLGSKYETLRTNGPGRLTKALQITHKRHNGINLLDPASELRLASGVPVPEHMVIQTTRIGITKAAEYPWRFYIEGNHWVSAK